MGRAALRTSLALALFLASSGWGAAQNADYVQGVQDLPLMPELKEDTDAGVVFDTATGRIVEVFARGRVSVRQVRAFYYETLPQLGWTRTALNEFQREGERLSLEFVDDRGQLTVSFRLSPI